MEETYESLTAEGWMGLQEAAEALGLSHPNYIRSLIKTGRLSPAKKVPEPQRNRQKWLVSPEAIKNFAGRQRAGRKKYFLYLNTNDNEAAFFAITHYLLENYNQSEFEFYPATSHQPKPRKQKPTTSNQPKPRKQKPAKKQRPGVDF